MAVMGKIRMQSLKLEILDHISDPGHQDKANDDALCFNDHMAAVLDGATGLGDHPIFDDAESDAAWLSRFAAPMLAGLEADLPEIVRAVNLAACREVAKRVDISKLPAFAWPTCGFEMVRLCGDRLEVGGLGDCVAYVFLQGRDEIVRHSALPASRSGETSAARHLLDAAGGLGSEGSIVHSGEALERLRQVRSLSNTPKSGVWTLGLVEEAAEHVKTLQVPVEPGDVFLLMSDGFSALSEAYGCHTPKGLVDAATGRGLAVLMEELRDVERVLDPDGKRFARFKRSDDATAILGRIRD